MVITFCLSPQLIFRVGVSPDFRFPTVIGIFVMILPGGSIDVDVAFTPSFEGEKKAILEISSNDPETPTVHVYITRVGVLQVSPPVSVADILVFFDASVATGTLVGERAGWFS
jgi:hypothetical protein